MIHMRLRSRTAYTRLSPLHSICTHASPLDTTHVPLTTPPVLAAKSRTRFPSAPFLLFSASKGQFSIPAFLGPARHVISYRRAAPDAPFLFDAPPPVFHTPRLGRRVPRSKDRTATSLAPRLEEMLLACAQTEAGRRALLKADVVTERGVLGKLMSNRKGAFDVSYAHGVLFMQPAGMPVHRAAMQSRTRSDSFQRACTLPHDGEVRTVVLRTLGGLNVLISGSTDCLQGRTPLQLVVRSVGAGDAKKLPRRTWKKWYLQAQMMDVPSLLIGSVGNDGTLYATERVKVQEIPTMLSWDPTLDFGWAQRVLSLIRDYCQEAIDIYGRSRMLDAAPFVWRVLTDSVAGEIRITLRRVEKEEDAAPSNWGKYGIVPEAVVKVYESFV